MECLCYLEIHNICDICHKPPCPETLLEGHKGITALLHISPCQFVSYCRDTFEKGINVFDLIHATKCFLEFTISKFHDCECFSNSL